MHPRPRRQGIHYTETLRAASPPTRREVDGPLTLSASLHRLEDVPRLRREGGGEGEGGGEAAVPPAAPLPYKYVFLSPVWASVSKAGYGPGAAFTPASLAADLRARPPAVPVIALGGLTPATARQVRGLGCAGAAVLGCVWEAPDPAAGWAAFVGGLDAGWAGGDGASTPL